MKANLLEVEALADDVTQYAGDANNVVIRIRQRYGFFLQVTLEHCPGDPDGLKLTTAKITNKGNHVGPDRSEVIS